MRKLSISNLRTMKHEPVRWSTRWQEAFGTPAMGGVWMVYGKSGQGKTVFAMQLARELAEQGYRVLYVSLEEGYLPSFREAVDKAGWSQGLPIQVSDGCSPEEIEQEVCRSQRGPQVVIVDSVQYWESSYGAKAEQVIEMRRKYPERLLVLLSHVDGREVDGRMAYLLKRDAMLRVQVDQFRAFHRGRGSAGPAGYLTVWEEGAKRYFLEGNNNNNNNVE